MNSLDWELARRKLIDQGVTDFTDGDIIRTIEDSKHIKNLDPHNLNAQDLIDSELNSDRGFKPWLDKGIA